MWELVFLKNTHKDSNHSRDNQLPKVWLRVTRPFADKISWNYNSNSEVSYFIPKNVKLPNLKLNSQRAYYHLKCISTNQIRVTIPSYSYSVSKLSRLCNRHLNTMHRVTRNPSLLHLANHASELPLDTYCYLMSGLQVINLHWNRVCCFSMAL